MRRESFCRKSGKTLKEFAACDWQPVGGHFAAKSCRASPASAAPPAAHQCAHICSHTHKCNMHANRLDFLFCLLLLFTHCKLPAGRGTCCCCVGVAVVSAACGALNFFAFRCHCRCQQPQLPLSPFPLPVFLWHPGAMFPLHPLWCRAHFLLVTFVSQTGSRWR